ncbi:MAG: sulfotransferase [Bacteroidia bacterium]|nr:sulfotransferase [Bacteroidia bacterium]
MKTELDTIFIVGAPRSGTTLVLNMLVKDQPEIGGSRKESQFYSSFNRQSYQLQPYLDSPYFQFLFSAEEIREIFAAAQNPLDFFRLAMQKYRQKAGIKVFVEKSPIHTLYFREICRDFPKARFIFIHRDPCANIQSLAFTQWIPLLADRLPGRLKQHKFLRYFSAMLSYEQFRQASREIVQSEECLLEISYEQLVLEEVDLRSELLSKTGLNLAPMYISRPFSDAVEHREYKLDRSRIEGYKRQMPLKVQNLIRLTFEPQRGGKAVLKFLFRGLILLPLVWIKKNLGKT